MAKVPVLKNDRQISNQVKEALRNRAGITHWAHDSMGRIFADTVSSEIHQTNLEDRRAFESIQLSAAKGRDLDALGIEWCDKSRLLATKASCNAKHRNIMFYSNKGTFGELNNNQAITIPAGTFIGSRASLSEQNSVTYITVTDTVLPPEGRIAYVGAQAVGLGEGFNVGESVLNFHNFEAYAAFDKGFLKCTNNYPILNGREQETDEEYRFRIASHIPEIVGNNRILIKNSAYTVAGVKEVRILPGFYGIGTAAVVCFGTDGETADPITKEVQKRLDRFQGPGLMLIAINGVKVYFDLELRCLITKDLSEVQKMALERSIKSTILASMKEREFTRTIDLRRVASQVLTTHPSITGLINSTSSAPGFERVYIRKEWSNLNPISERKRVVNDKVVLAPEEHVALGTITVFIDTEA